MFNKLFVLSRCSKKLLLLITVDPIQNRVNHLINVKILQITRHITKIVLIPVKNIYADFNNRMHNRNMKNQTCEPEHNHLLHLNCSSFHLGGRLHY